MKLWNWLLYLTNNEKTSRDEQLFDVIFLVINTTAVIFGIAMFIIYNTAEWIPILIIEYTWALDNLRNNRNY
jgi:hypothetical protein